ncbi:hypothetical protein D3C72_2468600 [compost metagenome]
MQDRGDRTHQIGIGELLGRQVDRHLQVAEAGCSQLLAHVAGLAHHPFADGDDQPGFLGHADELVRLDHAFLRMVPA